MEVANPEITVHETQPLISGSNTSGRNTMMKRAKQCFFVGQYPALLVLLWSLVASFFTHIPIPLDTTIVDGDQITPRDRILIIAIALQGAILLLYPFFGWLADALIKRYYVIGTSLYLILIGMVLGIGTSATEVFKSGSYNHPLFWVGGGTAVGIALLGNGLFQANAIQFGTDQMSEASSWQLSGFIHWYYWSSRLGNILIFYSALSIDLNNIKQSSVFDKLAYLTLNVAIAQLVFTIGGITVFHAAKRRLNIEPANKNPISTVFKVLKYSVKHKYPQNRSAFTFWEQDTPSRIDIGKNKYGGPFSTEQVEDTKTFLRILLLLVSLFGLRAVKNNTEDIIKEIRPSFGNISTANTTIFTSYVIIGYDSNYLTSLTVLVTIPLCQILLKPLLHNYYPGMLKRIWLGLLFTILSTTTVFVLKKENDKIDKEVFLNLIALPQILNGLAYILVFLTALEFILAQAPRSMQGLLIGLWYSMDVIDICLQAVSFTKYQSCLEVYITRLVLTVLSLIMYSGMVYFYKYRDRDNIVNSYDLIAEKVERTIANERLSQSSDLIIVSGSEYSINSSTADSRHTGRSIITSTDLSTSN